MSASNQPLKQAAATPQMAHAAGQVQIDINPATGEEIASYPCTDLSQLPAMITRAREAQKIWAQKSFKERQRYILKMQDYIAENAEELATAVSRSNGKTVFDALVTEVLPSAVSCQWYSANTARILKPEQRGWGSWLMVNKRYEIRYMPVGVVGIISPWNYPLSIPFGEIVMGLMAGNAVLLKVAEATVSVTELIEKIVGAAGLPAGLFQTVYGRGSQISSGFLAAGVDKLFFTGSVRAGKLIMAEAAQTLTPLSLELGGNDPMIVLEDADLERAVNGALWAGFQNAGQSCGGVERIYVHAKIYDEFLRQIKIKTERLTHGPSTGPADGVSIGSITTEGQLRTVQQHLEEALDKGARIWAQSKPAGDQSKGYFHPATVLVDTTDDMLCVREETFGPLVAVMKFDTVDEVIRRANDSDYALTASVWSCSHKTAMQVADRLEAGVVTINDHLYTHGLADMPWGAWKNSGMGRTHGPEGLLEMVNRKAVNWDVLSVKRSFWWYPHDKADYDALVHIIKTKTLLGLSSKFSKVPMVAGAYTKKVFSKWL